MILRNWGLEGWLNLAIFKFNSTALAQESLSEFAVARMHGKYVLWQCNTHYFMDFYSSILWASRSYPPLSAPAKIFQWFCGERLQRKKELCAWGLLPITDYAWKIAAGFVGYKHTTLTAEYVTESYWVQYCLAGSKVWMSLLGFEYIVVGNEQELPFHHASTDSFLWKFNFYLTAIFLRLEETLWSPLLVLSCDTACKVYINSSQLNQT